MAPLTSLLASLALAHPAPGIAVLPSGDVAFVQGPAHTIWIVTPGQEPRRLAVGKDATDLSVPHDLWPHAGNLVTASDRNSAVVTINPAGGVSRLFPKPTWQDATYPGDIAVAFGGDPFMILPDGSLIAVTRINAQEKIVKISPDGKVTDLCPDESFENLHVSCFAHAPDGTIYFTELGKRIRKIAPDQTLSTVIDSGLIGARGIAIDKDGSLVVADARARRILRIRNGKIETIAGTGKRARTDGILTKAAFMEPTGVAIAPDGTIYILDYPSDMTPAVREISPDGRVRTIATTRWP